MRDVSNSQGIIFRDHGSHFSIDQIKPERDSVDTLPPFVYKIRFVSEGGGFLGMGDKKVPVIVRDRQKFNVPAKIYGRNTEYMNRIIGAWNRRAGSTGLLTYGLKGTGKSLLAEMLANYSIDKGLPVLFIDNAVPVEVLRGIITALILKAGPCMVYFDEFGKVYNIKEQEELLSLFSDSEFRKVLFVLTENKKERLTKFIFDRPGRFLFKIKYEGMDAATVRAICQDQAVPPALIPELLQWQRVHRLSMDMLLATITETTMCNTPLEFWKEMEILNVPDMVLPKYKIDKVIFKDLLVPPELIRVHCTELYTLSFQVKDEPNGEGVSSWHNLKTLDVSTLPESAFEQVGEARRFELTVNGFVFAISEKRDVAVRLELEDYSLNRDYSVPVPESELRAEESVEESSENQVKSLGLSEEVILLDSMPSLSSRMREHMLSMHDTAKKAIGRDKKRKNYLNNYTAQTHAEILSALTPTLNGTQHS